MSESDPNHLNAATPEAVAMIAALDEALAASPVPVGLVDRVIAATESGLAELAGGRCREQFRGRFRGRYPVLRRIGAMQRYGMAAAILLMVVLGEVWWAAQTEHATKPQDGAVALGPTVPVQPDATLDPGAIPGATPVVTDDPLAAGLEQLAAVASEVDVFDERLSLLSMQVTLASNDGFWAETGTDSLQDAMTAYELDELSDELSLYF